MIKVYKNKAFEAEQFTGKQRKIFGYRLNLVVGDWVLKDSNGVEVVTDDELKNEYYELPVIPKPIADWIEYCKTQGINLEKAIDEFENPIKVEEWLNKNSLELFARAWLDGYQVEEQHDTRTD